MLGLWRIRRRLHIGLNLQKGNSFLIIPTKAYGFAT